MKNKLIDSFLIKLEVERKYSEHTIKKYELNLEQYFEYLDEVNIDILKSNHNTIKDFIYQLHGRDFKSTTISNYISTIKSFYKYLYDKEYIKKNYATSIRYPKKEDKLYEIIFKRELKDFFNEINKEEKQKHRNRVIFALLYATGIRVSECTNLTISDINFEDNLIKVYGKGKKERIVPVNTTVMDDLKKYIIYVREVEIKNSNEQKIFLNSTGTPITDRGIRYLATKFCKNASLSNDISPHKFRHTLATNLLNNGMDLRVVQEILGHDTLSTTEKYTHITSREFQDSYDKIVTR